MMEATEEISIEEARVSGSYPWRDAWRVDTNSLRMSTRQLSGLFWKSGRTGGGLQEALLYQEAAKSFSSILTPFLLCSLLLGHP